MFQSNDEAQRERDRETGALDVKLASDFDFKPSKLAI